MNDKQKKVLAEAAVGLLESLESGEGMNLPSMLEPDIDSLIRLCYELDIPVLVTNYEIEDAHEEAIRELLGPQTSDYLFSEFNDWESRKVPLHEVYPEWRPSEG